MNEKERRTKELSLHTFRPRGNGRVPAHVPPLPSGVAPAGAWPQALPGSGTQAGNGRARNGRQQSGE